ncbi:MAG TPA: multicopper oxidase domain-containing protein [Anaerolineales bacterium]|nr:multicopper oxidase domain-containing protein [Anaerolineales bacterium]
MEPKEPGDRRITRRDFLKAGLLSGGATAVAATLAPGRTHAGHEHGLPLAAQSTPTPQPGMDHGDDESHGGMGTVGQVDNARNGFDPQTLLRDWDFGTVSTLPNGQTLREYSIVAVNKEIEVAPGVFFPGWVYNGRVPGPTLRCVEGDRIRIEFINGSDHPHTIHFHGIHAASMDGVPGVGPGAIAPGGKTVYEFDAFPFGCHLYHCHATPLKRHIHKGLYGAFLIDPDPARHVGEDEASARARNHLYTESQAVNEMVMVMNAFDTNFDGDNEVYAVNTVAFAYMNEPIRIRRDQRQRLYLINLTEFDPINSMHLHANFFDYYDHGTTLRPTHRTIDTIMQCQAQRGILEFDFKGFEPGKYMFHAHQSEFVELGWMGFFEVTA